jgi:hypothetical protein
LQGSCQPAAERFMGAIGRRAASAGVLAGVTLPARLTWRGSGP